MLRGAQGPVWLGSSQLLQCSVHTANRKKQKSVSKDIN